MFYVQTQGYEGKLDFLEPSQNGELNLTKSGGYWVLELLGIPLSEFFGHSGAAEISHKHNTNLFTHPADTKQH